MLRHVHLNPLGPIERLGVSSKIKKYLNHSKGFFCISKMKQPIALNLVSFFKASTVL